MNMKSKTVLLPVLALLAGLLGLLLRFWLYATGLDADRLLIASHPAGYLVVILSLAFIAGAVYLARKTPGNNLFPRSLPGCIGSWIGAAGLLTAGLVDLVQKQNGLTVLAGVLGLAAGCTLALAAFQQLQGRKVSFVLHAVVCLYFLVRLVSRYQGWSADPQLHNYCPQLLAIICLMLYSYQRCELDVREGAGRSLLAYGMMGIYFCCLSLIRSDALWLYIGMIGWLGTNLGSRETALQEE